MHACLHNALGPSYIRARGFTLVELVATLLLVGILGVLAVSRFTSPSAADGLIVRDQVIAMARSAQQLSLGHGSVT